MTKSVSPAGQFKSLPGKELLILAPSRIRVLERVARWTALEDSPHRFHIPPWNEVLYRRDKASYWLLRGSPRRAASHLERLTFLLNGKSRHAILVQECLAIICEAKGDTKSALRHRTRQIHMCRRFLRANIASKLRHETRTEIRESIHVRDRLRRLIAQQARMKKQLGAPKSQTLLLASRRREGRG